MTYWRNRLRLKGGNHSRLPLWVFILMFLLFWVSSPVNSQDLTHPVWTSGLEVQQYPTGFIFSINGSGSLSSKSLLEVRFGYNLVRHRDLGVHEDERGGGFGASVGLVRSIASDLDAKGWFLGGRFDVWFNNIDWRDGIGTNREIRGETEAIVLQPTALAGYRFFLNENWTIHPTVALGVEINVQERGGEVGEGAILLWGLKILRRL